MSDDYAGFGEILEEKDAEIDRLREALQKIADLSFSITSGDVNFARMVAAGALEESNQRTRPEDVSGECSE